MKHLGLVLVLCGAAGLATTGGALAFELQSANTPPDKAAQLNGLNEHFLNQEFKGSSLAAPFVGESDSGRVSDYGNSIPIPGPGIDAPAPAWTYSSPYFQHRGN